jgi:GntR family transcriptional repressor for pyruvate dehydrogenase complex
MNELDMVGSHQLLHEKLAYLLEQKILDEELVSGELLPSERDLAEQYGLSRSVVRDALRILMARGLVTVRQGYGTVVTADQRKPYAQSLGLLLRRGNYSKLDIIEVRRILEVEVCALAAERLTPSAEAALTEALRTYEHAMQTGDSETAGRAHLQFHGLILQATRNQVLIDFLDPFVAFSVPSLLPLQDPNEVSEEEQHWADFRRHQDILDALRSRDPERARAAMREHMRFPEARVHRDLKGLQS